MISKSVQLANNENRKRYRFKNPETAQVSGFFRAIFQGAIQKISFPQNGRWGGLELKPKDLRGRF